MGLFYRTPRGHTDAEIEHAIAVATGNMESRLMLRIEGLDTKLDAMEKARIERKQEYQSLVEGTLSHVEDTRSRVSRLEIIAEAQNKYRGDSGRLYSYYVSGFSLLTAIGSMLALILLHH